MLFGISSHCILTTNEIVPKYYMYFQHENVLVTANIYYNVDFKLILNAHG